LFTPLNPDERPAARREAPPRSIGRARDHRRGTRSRTARSVASPAH